MSSSDDAAPPSQPEPEPSQSDSLWGLATALGDWGMGGFSTNTTTADPTTAAAAAATQDETTTKQPQEESLASDAEFTTMTEGLTNVAAEIESTALEATTAVSSAIWSTLDSVSNLKNDPSSSLLSLYTSTINKPSEWIDSLERENSEKQSHKGLRESLDVFVKAHPSGGTYEEWVEGLLEQEGWDEGSAVVDQSFYTQESAHRNLWNERNYEDGIDINDKNPQRAYVPASAAASGEDKAGGSFDEEIVFVQPEEDKEEQQQPVKEDDSGKDEVKVVSDASEQPITNDDGDLDDLT